MGRYPDPKQKPITASAGILADNLSRDPEE